MKKIVLCLLIGMLYFSNSNAQKIRPFTTTVLGVTFTGTYSDGCLRTRVVNGVSVLFGLVTWGGSTETYCTPGCDFCKLESSIMVGRMTVKTNKAGEKCFENANAPTGITPVLVGVKDGSITFAVDINQTAEHHRSGFNADLYVVKSPFILDPGTVRALKLSNSAEDMGYIIPAGKYPLYRDGNIYYWTFTPPSK